MVAPETWRLVFGLSSAAAWRAGDFSGGFATRHSSVLAVVFISQGIGLALTGGCGFGLLFIFVDQASQETILWPLVSARVASLVLIGTVLVFTGHRKPPSRRRQPLIALAGLLDTAGNGLFALAAHLGRLDVAAVLSSRHPLSTVMLARFILREHLRPRQWAGVRAALGAMVLITV